MHTPKFKVGDKVTNALGTTPMFRASIESVYPTSSHPQFVQTHYSLINSVSGALMGLYAESELLPDGATAEPVEAGSAIKLDAKTATVGVKHDNGKASLALLSPIAVNKIGRVMDYGAQKYADHNWRKGIQWSRLLSACLRHVFAYIGGEDKDSETGISHLAHAACCLMFLLEYEETHQELDNRYKPDNQKGA